MIVEQLEKVCCGLHAPMFFLKHGRAFEKYIPRPDWVEPGTPKECFRNSFLAVSPIPHRLVYCEGMALPEDADVPYEHAWVITHDEVVIDPTWHDLWPDRKVEYWGIPMKWDYVLKTIWRTHTFGIVQNWKEDFPLLHGKVPVEEYLWTPTTAGVEA